MRHNPPLYEHLKNWVEKLPYDNKRLLNTITSERNEHNEIVVDGDRYVNFSSNDYLGLRHHPFVIEKSVQYAQKYGSSVSASRLVTGTFDIYTALENDLAVFKGKAKALIFNSGFQANSAILSCLASATPSPPDVFTDKLNHASMHDGLRHIRQKRYPHLDLDYFEKLLKGSENAHKLAVTESIFSMDGDRVDVERWAHLCRQYQALSFIDEAHSSGVMGGNGEGITTSLDRDKGIDIDMVMGTFGKAWGNFGAYIATDKTLYDYIINACRGFIYTTALPPSVIGGITASLELMPTLCDKRERLKNNAQYIRKELQHLGYATKGDSQIIPVIIGSNHDTMTASAKFRDNGIWISAIRTPHRTYE